MAKKKLESPITLFAAIEAEQHEALRTLAYDRKKSMADLVREAIGEYIKVNKGSSAAARARKKTRAT
jgi:hypothetical protein